MADWLQAFWGWVDTLLGPEYRRPLPTTEQFPAQEREVGDVPIPGVHVPPYVLAREMEPGVVDVMLTAGSGKRAAIDGEPVYISGPNVPPEWKDDIKAALVEIREKWPEARLKIRPDDGNATHG